MSFGTGRGQFVDPKSGMLSPDAQRLHAIWEKKLEDALTIVGELKAALRIQGRTEGIGTTVGKLTNIGHLDSTDSIAADGTGSPLTGGRRSFVAFDGSSRLTDSFRNNQINVTSIPTTDGTLSNDGVSTAIVISSNSNQYGAGSIANNLGSVDPGTFGTYSVYYDDPTYTGGPVIYQVSSDILQQGANDGRQLVGTIGTVLGTPFTGGGNKGGTGGGGGGRGFNKF